MKFIVPFLISFIVTFLAVPLVIRLAKACKCLDVPGERRLHKKITPRWGGVAFFAGVMPVLFLLNGDRTLTAYIVASFILVGIGAIDDRYGLGWKIKLAGNAAAATIVIFGGNAIVRHIGTYGVLGSVDLGWYGIPLTYLGIIGVTNAINLLDGLNGLAGGVSLLGFLFMGIAAGLAGNVQVALICFAFVGALGAFLRFNFPHARIFMGDSGSLFLGFSLSFMAVLLTQNATSPLEPMFPVLVLLLPIFDALRVIFVRLLNRKSPFHADNLHLHYLMVQRNFSPVNAVLLLWSVTAACGVTALVLAERTSASYLFVVIYASLFLGIFALSLTQGQQQARWAGQWDAYLRRLKPRWTRGGIRPARGGDDRVWPEAAGGAGAELFSVAPLSLVQEFQSQRRHSVSEHHGLHGLQGDKSEHLFTSAAHHQLQRPAYGRRFHKKAGPLLHPDAEVW